MHPTNPAAPPVVPVAGVDRFAIDWSVNSVLLTLGQPLVQVAPDGTIRAGNPTWFLSLGMSPNTLKQLRDLTVDAVARYERMHGPIAVPSVSVTPPAADESKVISLIGGYRPGQFSEDDLRQFVPPPRPFYDPVHDREPEPPPAPDLGPLADHTHDPDPIF